MSQISVDKMLGPKLLKRIPRFVVNYLKRILHEDDINNILTNIGDIEGADFLKPGLDSVDFKFIVRGAENLPKSGRFVFACNHPLGGPEALVIGEVVHQYFGDNLKFVVNSLLCALEPLKPIFVPVNTLGGGQNRETSKRLNEMFASDDQVCIFPAGICARKIDGKITEMPWKKMFVTRAKASQRDIIPVHCTGQNSRRFYFLANLCKFFHLKFNIAMLYLVDELFKKRGETFTVTFGEPIAWQSLTPDKSDAEWAAEIREKAMLLEESRK